MLENNEKVSKMKPQWNLLDWSSINVRVFRIQKQIYKYSVENRGVEEIHRLQRVLTNMFECKLLAVRRVTQDNQGKNTAGINQVKSVSPTKRMQLAKNICIGLKGSKTLKVMIPQPNSSEYRPLGIPTIQDRATRALALMALEPQWEAKFEPNSYGFRPGRGCHDAIEAIHSSINKKPKYVLDAYIRKCLHPINHGYLLNKLDTYPIMRKQINGWMKSGLLFQSETLFPETGRVQEDRVSPFLSNVALHGMENMLKDWVTQFPAYNPGKTILSLAGRRSRLTLVRYADHFVLLHPDKSIVIQAKALISDWLEKIGLELHPLKTSIKHTYIPLNNKRPGFKFKGFWIRNYPVNTPEQGKRKSGYKTYIRAHPDNISAVMLKIKRILKSHLDTPTIVKRLNPIIKGWSNYYRTVASKKTFSSMDKDLMNKLIKWARRKHPKRNAHWVVSNYLHKSLLQGTNKNRFGYFVGKILKYVCSFAETPITRHHKIAGKASPYNGNWTYWILRTRDVKSRRLSLQKIICNQKGR